MLLNFGIFCEHLLRGELEDVGDNLHGERRRIDIGVAHHELLQDIVLDGSCHLFQLGTLLQTGIDIESQHGQNGTVHGHGDGHLVQGYTVEEHLHVLQRADAHACLAHITDDTGIVRVVTTVRRQVEGYGQSLLTACQVAAVESVRLLGRRETGILTDSPRAEGVHHTIRATEEGRNTGGKVQMLHAF